MRCAVIEAEKANYPITWMCEQLGVSRSSFYAWRAQADTVTATAARRRVLAELVAKVFDDSRPVMRVDDVVSLREVAHHRLHLGARLHRFFC